MMQSAIRTTVGSLLRSSRSQSKLATRLGANANRSWSVIKREQSTKPFNKIKNIDNIILEKGASLPYTTSLKGGFAVRIERITKDTAAKAWNLLRLCVEQGTGYSADELEPLDEFTHNAETKRTYFQLVDPTNEEPICLLAMKPCPLARSEHTVHFSVLVTVNPDYRGKGLGHSFIAVATLDIGRNIMGHPGYVLGRTALGRGVNALQNSGVRIIGTIPNCSYLEGKGWTADIIVNSINKGVISDKLKQMPEPELSPLITSDTIPTTLQSDKPRLSTWSPLVMDWGTFDVELASPKDVWRVEEMIRQAAEKGDGFGLDEFNSQGQFNRKLMYESTVLVAKSSDDVIMSAAIFGPSKICRAFNATQTGGYIIVNDQFRERGLGGAFTKYLIDYAPELGFTDILTDVYVSNSKAIRMLQKHSFFLTGSMPHAGYVKGKGYSDSILHYLNLGK